jgi:hypothetical protein
MMPEQREQNDDRQWYANQPKQSPSSETHATLLIFATGERPRLENAATGSTFPGFDSFVLLSPAIK